MITQFELKDNKVYLHGDLMFNTVETVLRDSQRFFLAGADSSVIIINMQNVSQVDSSALSLMCEWMRLAEQNKKTVLYEAVHIKLQNLMDVCGIKDLLLHGKENC